MPNPKCGPFNLKKLWQDSLRRGLFARAMGQALGMEDAEELFSAALLQDMAIPLLSKELPTEYAEMLAARSEGKRLSDLEQERFGWTHSEAAGAMARSWNLPESFATYTETHTHLDALIDFSSEEPARVAVALSALLPAAVDDEWPERIQFKESFDILRADHPNMPAPQVILEQIDSEFDEFAPVLKLSDPGRLLLEWYESK